MLKFKWFHLTWWWKISVIWIIILWISLFSSWIDFSNTEFSGNPFSKTSGHIGFTLLCIIIFILFLIFSFHKKEKIKLWTDLNFRDYNAIIVCWVLSIILVTHSMIFITGFQTLSSEISIWKWPTIAIIWWIFITIWGILLKRETKNSNKSLIIDDIHYKETTESRQENMKLPF